MRWSRDSAIINKIPVSRKIIPLANAFNAENSIRKKTIRNGCNNIKTTRSDKQHRQPSTVALLIKESKFFMSLWKIWSTLGQSKFFPRGLRDFLLRLNPTCIEFTFEHGSVTIHDVFVWPLWEYHLSVCRSLDIISSSSSYVTPRLIPTLVLIFHSHCCVQFLHTFGWLFACCIVIQCCIWLCNNIGGLLLCGTHDWIL